MIRPSTAGVGALVLAALMLSPAGVARAQGTLPLPSSTYLATWPVSIKPNDIAANPEDGTLAVVDAGHDSIEILRPGGTHREHRLKGLRDPRSAAFLAGGVLLVGEAGTGSVKGYDPDGHVVLTLGSPHGEFLTPNDIAVHPVTGHVFVVDSALDAVKVYRQSDGAFLFQFGSSGSGPGQLSHPIAIAIDAVLGEVFVSDSRNVRIAVYDAATGGFRRNVGSLGKAPGEFSFPAGLHVDDEHRLYAVESLGGLVQLFDPDGGYIGQIGEHGTGAGQLRSPKAILIDRYNRLLVTSFMDQKIELWGLDEFENPVDDELEVVASVIPAHINTGLPRFQVVFQVSGIDPEQIDPAQVLVNGVAAETGSYRMGPHLSARFSTVDVLATLPPDVEGPITLTLTGATAEGVPFSTELAVVIVPYVPEGEATGGSEG